MRKRAREQLRENVDFLLTQGGTTYGAVVKTGKISNGTLGRLRDKDTPTGVSVDRLDDLADAFGKVLDKDVQPWQLLHPDGLRAQPQKDLSADAMEIARKLDQIRARDPKRYDVTLAYVRLAVIPSPPMDPEQREEWAEDMVQLLRASLAPQLDQ